VIGSGNGVLGAYYNGNFIPQYPSSPRSLFFFFFFFFWFAGVNFGSLIAVRPDPNINFNWAAGSPAYGIPSDMFSVRWNGTLLAKYSGKERRRKGEGKEKERRRKGEGKERRGEERRRKGETK
jgi:hypothetical protein